MAYTNQESLEVWVFGSQDEAVENAVYLSGYRSDVDRALMSARVSVPTDEDTLRLFSVDGPEETKRFALEPCEDGFCLWLLDEVQEGRIHVLSHTMEDMEGWEARNEFTYNHSGVVN